MYPRNYGQKSEIMDRNFINCDCFDHSVVCSQQTRVFVDLGNINYHVQASALWAWLTTYL